MQILASIPSPSQGVGTRTRAAPGIRPVHHPGRHRRRLVGAAAGSPAAAARHGRRRRGVGGAVRPRRRPDLPRHHRLPAYFGDGARPGRRAADLEGRPRHLGRHRLRRARRLDRLPAARDPAPGRSPTRWRPASCSPRRSAAWATGSTRSCSAGPTDLPWGLEIDPAHRPERATSSTRPTTRPSSTSSSGRRRRRLVIWADRRFRLGHGRAFALYVAALHASAALDREAAGRPGHHILGLRLNDWTSDRRSSCWRGDLLRRLRQASDPDVRSGRRARARGGASPASGPGRGRAGGRAEATATGATPTSGQPRPGWGPRPVGPPNQWAPRPAREAPMRPRASADGGARLRPAPRAAAKVDVVTSERE